MVPAALDGLAAELLRAAKQAGFSDAQIAEILCTRTRRQGSPAPRIPAPRIPAPRIPAGIQQEYRHHGVPPSANCGTPTGSAPCTTWSTPARRSSPPRRRTSIPRTDGETGGARRRGRPKVIILGSGPNRIGQGIEFDYACVHASFALSQAGYETVMVNCNPETVSTDYDTSGRLYFEPLTLEDVLEVGACGNAERAGGRRDRATRRPDPAGPGCGRSPPRASRSWGTSPEAIHLAEDRGEFGAVLAAAGLPAPRPAGGLVRGRQGRRGRDRLPGAGAALLRARRPRHGDRL